MCPKIPLSTRRFRHGRKIGQTLSDSKGIVAIQGDQLDHAYITQWLTEFSLLLEKPILERYEQIVNVSYRVS